MHFVDVKVLNFSDNVSITVLTYGGCKDGLTHSQARTGGVSDTTPDTRLC